MKKVLIVGAGVIAQEYAKILTALDVGYDVFCRRQESAEQFFMVTGVLPKYGTLEESCRYGAYNDAIVATTVESLPKVALQLANLGVKNILLEKPGAVNLLDLEILQQAEQIGSRIYVAYNRRFYASVKKAKQIIAEDGGIISCFFDFTEWSHIIEKVDKSQFTKEHWFFANSTHVIDLAFNMIGMPSQISCLTGGELSWHKFPAIYVGSGVSVNGVYFSYHSNWSAPGRWSLEINTKNLKLIFKPLEKLKIQHKGKIEELSVEIDDELDQEFKPGFFEQVKTFIFDENKSNICDLAHLERELLLFNKIAGVNLNA